MLFGQKDQLSLKRCLPQIHFLESNFLSSTTYFKHIKIELFCKNLQMTDHLKRLLSTISYEFKIHYQFNPNVYRKFQ